ncbi:MAG: glycosyltransferase [Sandarakinorhabdus sp.]|nr:glycosyltransferase [Sandarakinorhabdus sp.]
MTIAAPNGVHDAPNGTDTPAPPRVSIIIPHLNTPDALSRCLESITAQRLGSGQAEIIVVDNGSSVPLDALRAAFPGVLFLAEPAAGPGPARNRGAAAARADILAFIDADCGADAGWLQAAVDAVEADPAQTIAGGDIRIDYLDPTRPTPIEAYEAVYAFNQQTYIERKHFSVTANLAMARGVHAAVGPFGGIDVAEDIDWGKRAHAAGFRTRYFPEMRVFHPARDDYPALVRKWQRLVRHGWNDHLAAGAPRWQWQAKAAALVISVPLVALRVLTSDRLSGLSTRLRAVPVLARIRAFRAAEMIRVMSAPGESAGAFWNRQA